MARESIGLCRKHPRFVQPTDAPRSSYPQQEPSRRILSEVMTRNLVQQDGLKVTF